MELLLSSRLCRNFDNVSVLRCVGTTTNVILTYLPSHNSGIFIMNDKMKLSLIKHLMHTDHNMDKLNVKDFGKPSFML